MHRAGLNNVQMLRVDNSNPYIYGQWLHARNKPTVFLYAHQDVQPAGPLADWKSSPWKLTPRDGRLFGRGTADDKGAITAQLAAISAFLKMHGRLPVNIKMLVESEEEIGSPHLTTFFRKYRKLIRSDVVVVCDTENIATGLPSITSSLRGILQAQLTVESAERPLHSGLGGGVVPDAALALNVILSRLYNGNGKLPAFLNRDILPTSKAEMKSWRDLPGSEESRRKNFGVLPGVKLGIESRRNVHEQIWRRPSVTIIAQDAGSIRHASNQILPRASAIISCRTVPNQKPSEIFRELQKFLTARPPWNVRVNLKLFGTVDWWTGDTDGFAFDAAKKSLRAGYGKEPVLIGGGGSIGFIRPLSEMLNNAPVLLLGIEDPQSKVHFPNESLHENDYAKLIVSLCHLFENLSRSR